MDNRSNLTSSLLENAVDQLTMLPGIGKKSALRFAMHLLNQPVENVEKLGQSIIKLRREIQYCSSCNMISDSPLCSICSDKKRDPAIICVVENIRDVLSIERTNEYRGLYHVLGGIISPMDGISPSDLNIDNLISRANDSSITEVLLALTTTMEGETTSYYLYRKLKDLPIKISVIARGVGFGDELEFTDELTLGRSIINRQPFIPNP